MSKGEDNSQVRYTGAFVPKPKIPKELRLQVTAHTFHSDQENSLIETIPEHFDGAIFKILRSGDGESEICGSGYFIAPGLALTATHVFAGIERGDRFRALSLRNDGSIQHWSMEHYTHKFLSREAVLTGKEERQSFDISLVSLYPRFELGPTLDLNVLEQEVEVPEVGDPVIMVGFRAPEVEAIAPEVGQMHFQMLMSTGKIVEVYPEGRGWNFPAPFAIAELETPGGMSGGPVFNRHGRAIGVLTASVGDALGGSPSYFTLNWSAMLIDVPAPWPWAHWPEGKGSVGAAVARLGLRVIGFKTAMLNGETVLEVPERGD